MNLKIHKRHLADVEQYTRFGKGGAYYPYSARYIFNLPEDSKYKDYALMLDTEDCKFENGSLVKESVGSNYERKGNHYNIDVKDDAVFVLTKYKGREQGKKYKRYTVGVAELVNLYNFEGKDLGGMEIAVAEVAQYLNNGTRYAGSVVTSRYKVGYIDGSWFYDGDERRKLHTKGVKLICKIPSERREEAEEFIADFYESRERLERDKQEINLEMDKYDYLIDAARKLIDADVSKEIQEKCEAKRKQLLDRWFVADYEIKDREGKLLSELDKLKYKGE